MLTTSTFLSDVAVALAVHGILHEMAVVKLHAETELCVADCSTTANLYST
jgi:hypothetical protein